MRILLLGNGGREHALCWKLAQSRDVKKIYTAPGNPGTATVPKNTNAKLNLDDISGLTSFASTEGIDLTVVGPEKPLSLGVADAFRERGMRIFGPTKDAAALETSKLFAKRVMREAQVPTAKCEVLLNEAAARGFLKKTQYPLVLKVDGLAAGKGVAVCAQANEAEAFLDLSLQQKWFGQSDQVLLAEEFLQGPEVSVFAICDGMHFQILGTAQDHKRLLDGDQGPNTGGMGAYAPAAFLTDDAMNIIKARVFSPVLETLARRGTPFVGILYAGMMLTPQGPKVLEFNVRFGDPEAQAVMPLLESDFANLAMEACRGRIDRVLPQLSPKHALTLVLAASGYPMKPKTGTEIHGIEAAQKTALVFHAGTESRDGGLFTSGGRVLAVTGVGTSLKEASQTAYQAAELIEFEGKLFRKDIGRKAL